MDQATQTMIDNLQKNTGKSLAQWIEIVKKENFAKHGEILTFLKEKHGFTHGFANLVAHKAKGSDAGSAENQDELVVKQYQGKEHFIPIYEKVIAAVKQYGPDVEIAPKISSVSLRRKKQFALLQPATKTRYEIGINLKGHPGKGKLEVVNTANAMCSHKINLSGPDDLDSEVLDWIKTAYDNAG